MLSRRKLKLKPDFECSSSNFSFKCLVPGGFNRGLIASTCTALPCCSGSIGYACACDTKDRSADTAAEGPVNHAHARRII